MLNSLTRAGACSLLLACGAFAQNGFIENRSYDTLCAEVDNVNIPLFFTNTTAYRIMATLPAYYPVATNSAGADFGDCGFTDRGIWIIGTNTSANEFLQTVTNPSYDYYAIDNPTAGVDQAWSNFPKEINIAKTPDEYIHFTAAESGDANTELTIGANLTIKLDSIVTTLQLRVETWTGSGWVDRGSKYFSPTNMTLTWSIPDFTWLPGTDSNIIHLQAVSTGSAAGAWAVYDYLELRKRDEAGPTEYTLYDDGRVNVKAVYIDFWWRAPQSMKIGVTGGLTNNNAHYLRITRKEPSLSRYNEIFVLYEDGNARIIPFPTENLPSVPYGASVILGPTVEGSRPVSPIDAITVDPRDLSLDLQYESGATAHVELYVDRGQSVVDVTGITYDTSTQSFARLRSMWVHDGKSDLDRVGSQEGAHPILHGWSSLRGSWWRFFHEVPSYHNTYCPDFALEVTEPSQAFLAREAETLDSGVNYTVVSRPGASGGAAVAIPVGGGEATFNVSLQQLYPQTSLRLRYSDADGGDNGTNLGNRIDLYVDGVWTAATRSANTGGSNCFETAAGLNVGDLFPGPHTFRIVVGSGTGGMDMDALELVSYRTILQATNTLVTRQGESVDGGSGYAFTNRVAAVNGTSLVMRSTGATASYNVSLPSARSNVFLRLRHADEWNPTRLTVSVDGVLAAKTPSMTEGAMVVENPEFEIGAGGGATPSGWFMSGACAQESWAQHTGTNGMAFYGWTVNGAGYFGQEVCVDPRFGSLFTLAMWGLHEPPFKSTTGVIRLKLELWVRGESTARTVAVQNVCATLTNAPNTWQFLRVRVTNTVPEINLAKIVADFSGATGAGGVIKWDGAQLFQGRGSGPDYFANAGLMYLGDLSSGSHTVTLTSAAETLGMEVDEFELFSVARSNRSPLIVAPPGFALPVGSSTSFVVHLLEYDPDGVLLSAPSAPAGSTFVTNVFAWTAGSSFEGTTNTVTISADDQQGGPDSVTTSNVVITVPFDSDGDQMGDGWEWGHFSSLTNGADGDNDDDEYDNEAEYTADTLPNNATSFVKVAELAGNGPDSAVRTVTRPGRAYSIYYKDSLLPESEAWQPFANTNVGFGTWLETGATESAHTFVDDGGTNTTWGAPASGRRFYRVEVRKP